MAQSISDEELQLKKRARRRLVGAIALVLLAVVFLPMVLDKEPKPVGQDIAIRIPSQEDTSFHPAPLAAPQTPPAVPVAPPAVVENKPAAADAAQASSAVAPIEPKLANAPTDKPAKEHADMNADTSVAAPHQKPAALAVEKVKPAPVAKHESASKSEGYVILLGAFANMDNAKQRQAQLNSLGIRFYTEKIKASGGDKLRVRAGPYATRDEAEKVLGRLKTQGIKDGVVAEKNS